VKASHEIGGVAVSERHDLATHGIHYGQAARLKNPALI
jgi:hypothetical protein